GAALTGWVKGEYTVRISPPPAQEPPATPPPPARPPSPPPVEPPVQSQLPKQVIASASTAIRVGRDPEYDRVATVRAWEHLDYVESAEGWFKVQNASGARGWLDGRVATVEDIGVEFARKALYSVKENDWSMQFHKVREVVPGGTGLSFRQGPSTDAAILRSLTQGDRMKLLEVPPTEFVKVMLPDGATGWVSRTWIKPVASPVESVRLTRTSPGILRLEVTGLTAAPAVTAAGGTLTVSLPDNAARTASLQVQQHGVSSMAMGRQSLAVSFEQSFAHTVVERTDNRLVVEVRPVVRQVETIPGADRVTYRFHMAGTVQPSAQRGFGMVALDLPGARLDSGAALPPELRVTPSAGGLAFQIVDGRAFAVKRGPDYVDLILFAPGLSGKTIVLDPGHGGVESGAVGPTGLLEKEANLVVSLKLKALLEAAGAQVMMTRMTDVRCTPPAEMARVPAGEQLRYDLNCRTVVANKAGADLFLSVHSNANPSRYEQGTETYWSAENLNAAQSKNLATLVQREVAALGLRNRGVKEEMFYVIKFSDAPAALAELAFVSNAWEESLLKQDAFRQKAAEALFRALGEFFGS
ncbi:MAG TPA: N-acetylmuramoyl-L-alanine amidase, partial [Symbiobacteriaceae bacterium]|nr:N-acetylmuramoyl-L-alanine amidase [Symbiobacteriaceae bacterium]